MRASIGSTLVHGIASFAIIVVAPVVFWLLMLDGIVMLFGGEMPSWLRIGFAAFAGLVLSAVWASLRIGHHARRPQLDD